MNAPIQIRDDRDPVLWSVIETHLDEGAFAFSKWVRSMDSSRLGLVDVARGPERRLLAHVHGLSVGGDAVFERVLEPLFQAPNRADPDELSVAVMVALMAGRRRCALSPVLWDWGTAAREATVRACLAIGDVHVSRWAIESLTKGVPEHQRVWMLDLAEVQRVPVGLVMPELHAERPVLLSAACRAARRTEGAMHRSSVDHLLMHEDPQVRDEALLTALELGSAAGFARCRDFVRSRESCTPLGLELLALLGTSADHHAIVRALGWPEHRRAAVWALGLTGNVAMVDPLLGLLDARGPEGDVVARLAAEALSLVTGIDPGAADLRAEGSSTDEDSEAADALPSLDDDDLDADLVPGPEHEIPRLQAGATRRWWDRHRSRFSPRRRYLGGRPLHASGIVNLLSEGCMRYRHAFARVVSIRSGGRWHVSTRARTEIQRAQLRAFAVECARGSDLVPTGWEELA